MDGVLVINYSYFFRISEEDYVKAIKEEIRKVVELQEELDLDVLVHGEPEVNLIPNSISSCWAKLVYNF